MSHGKAPRHPRQGDVAEAHVAAPQTSDAPPTVLHVYSTPDLSSSRGCHCAPVGGSGTTANKPKPPKRPGPIA